jgi:hypothetical protein
MQREDFMQLQGWTITEAEKADAIPTIYCNNIRMIMSGIDVMIDVGQAQFNKATPGKDGNPGILPVEFKARIVMSPQQAKILAVTLTQNIQKYEADFGEIVVQPKNQPKNMNKPKTKSE